MQDRKENIKADYNYNGTNVQGETSTDINVQGETSIDASAEFQTSNNVSVKGEILMTLVCREIF